MQMGIESWGHIHTELFRQSCFEEEEESLTLFAMHHLHVAASSILISLLCGPYSGLQT